MSGFPSRYFIPNHETMKDVEVHVARSAGYITFWIPNDKGILKPYKFRIQDVKGLIP